MREVLETVSEVQFKSIAVIVAAALLGMVATWYLLTGSTSPVLTHAESQPAAEPLPEPVFVSEPITASQKPEGDTSTPRIQESPTPPALTKSEFAVQIGAFQQHDGAKQRVKELEEQGYSAGILPYEEGFRVVLGGFGTREEAVLAANELKAAGFEAFVRRIGTG
jgi:cell division protein FtsN